MPIDDPPNGVLKLRKKMYEKKTCYLCNFFYLLLYTFIPRVFTMGFMDALKMSRRERTPKRNQTGAVATFSAASWG